MWNKGIALIVLLLTMGLSSVALASTKAPSSINSFSIALDSSKHFFDYGHPKFIGVCVWLDFAWGLPRITSTLEMDEYLPDLVVTVFNEKSDDPWFLANHTLDKASFVIGNTVGKSLTGFSMGNGDTTSNNSQTNQGNSLITKYVDVVGNISSLRYMPDFFLRFDTKTLFPYYSSAVDTPGRLGDAEALRFIQNINLFKYIIGSSFINKWGYEFPRSMTSNTYNDYEASVMAALRAVDIVTNRNTLHLVKSTENSCGVNCSVANVIEEQRDKNEIWQEIYPHDRHIQLGEDARHVPVGHYLGEGDDKAGNGNYVFVVWRHYRGCVQHSGQFLWAMQYVSPTQKR